MIYYTEEAKALWEAKAQDNIMRLARDFQKE